MQYVKLLFVVLHVASAALLFGAPLGLVRLARKGLETSDEAFKLVAAEVARRSKLAMIGGMSTLVTGVILIFLIGGFAAAPKNFHAALGLLLVALAFSFAFMKPNTQRIVQASQAASLDKASVEATLSRLAMGSGVLHGAWIIALILMFVRF